MLDSQHVTIDHELILVWEALELRGYFDFHEVSLFFLDQIDFVDSFFNTKIANVFSEFARAKLRKVEDIID